MRVLLLGAPGSGKTTLLHVLAQARRPGVWIVDLEWKEYFSPYYQGREISWEMGHKLFQAEDPDVRFLFNIGAVAEMLDKSLPGIHVVAGGFSHNWRDLLSLPWDRVIHLERLDTQYLDKVKTKQYRWPQRRLQEALRAYDAVRIVSREQRWPVIYTALTPVGSQARFIMSLLDGVATTDPLPRL
jgi:hypothetical protein